MKKVFATVLMAVLLFQPFLVSADYSNATAESYLLNHADNAWSTMALAVLGKITGSLDYLKNINASKAIDYTAPILALTTVGENPSAFASEDYVAKLKTYYQNGQLGDAATLNDDIFGLLALTSAGLTDSDSVVSGVKDYLLQTQGEDGGWGFATDGASDSNMTAVAIVALKAVGMASDSSVIQNGLNYLKTAQNDDGGFTWDPKSQWGTASDSSSTAWVMWALTAVSQDQSAWTKNGKTPKDYLTGNQAENGYFAYQTGTAEDAFSAPTTAYAVIALAGKTLPLATVTPTQEEFSFRIEGKDNNVCAGKAVGPTALDVIKNSAEKCGFTYHIKEMSFGPYLDKINNDEASGLIGWLYLVNYVSPAVGANDYVLQSGDEVLWYFGDFNWQPLKVSLSQTEITTGGSSQATVEYFNGSTWAKLDSAKVYYGTNEALSDVSGQATLSPDDGYFKIFAGKENYIRSNSELLKVGAPATQEITLQVNLGEGVGEVLSEEEQSGAAFTVDSGKVDFGTLLKGQKMNKDLTISNNGEVALVFASQVTGNDLFVDHLSLNQKDWRNFSQEVESGAQAKVNASLAVPASIIGSGVKTGKLIFWATVK